MKTFRTDIFIFLGLLTLTALIFLLTMGQSAIDLQLHDTYFVLDNFSLAIVVIGPLTFLIFFSRGLTRKFRTRETNTGLMVGLILLALITCHIIQLQKSYLSEIMKLDDISLADREQFAAEAKRRVNLSWGIFAFFILAVFLLTFRTIRISTGGYSQNNKRTLK